MRWTGCAVAAAVATLACGAAAQAPAAWRAYHNDPYGFSVDLPAEAQVNQGTTPTKAGPVPTLTGIVDLHERGVLIFVVTDYGTIPLNPDPNVVLEGAVKGGVGNVKGGVLDSEQTISVQGAPGRDMAVHTDQVMLRSRLILVGHRIYGVIGVGETKTGVPVEYDRFAASLSVDHPVP